MPTTLLTLFVKFWKRLDWAVFDWIQHRNGTLWTVILYVSRDLTSLGNGLAYLFTFLVFATLLLANQHRTAWAFLITMAATAGLVASIKLLVGRPCPLQPDPYQKCRTGALMRGHSFPVPHLPCMPSGHTCAAVVLYGIVASLIPYPCQDWAFWWGFSLGVVVGFTRIILSAHWTSDVVAGFALGHLLLAAWRWV